MAVDVAASRPLKYAADGPAPAQPAPSFHPSMTRRWKRWNAAARMLHTLRPYAFPMMLWAYVPALLLADSHATLIEQDLLGLATLAFLVVSTRFSSPRERWQVWILVVVATCFELDCSIAWGLYRYRLENLPLYVPPGHGLVYLFALRWAMTPIMKTRAVPMRWIAFGIATAWAVSGLTLSPWLSGRIDIWGALCLPVFAWFLTRRSGNIYVGAFLVTSMLELIGTGLGNWTWMPVAPVLHIPVGNPPSAIAAGYCLMDCITLWLVTLIPASLNPAATISARLRTVYPWRRKAQTTSTVLRPAEVG